MGDLIPPGPGLAGDVWQAGLERLSDDELIGVLRAGRRLASWAAAMELAVAGDLARRRLAEEEAGETGAAEHITDEVAAALTLTGRAADRVVNLALDLSELPATAAALASGEIDLPRAWVIADETSSLAPARRSAVEQAILACAGTQTTTELHRAARRAVIAVDPAAAKERKERAQWEARSSAGTSLLGPPRWPGVTCRPRRCSLPTATSPASPRSSKPLAPLAPWTSSVQLSISRCSAHQQSQPSRWCGYSISRANRPDGNPDPSVCVYEQITNMLSLVNGPHSAVTNQGVLSPVA
ncbi:MAG TPA: DUF222 domain-containing protein [Streptosporangiaceae bacterium]|nr:DUF222 domain-containing protein [Streptosporangiaceae bacterium]